MPELESTALTILGTYWWNDGVQIRVRRGRSKESTLIAPEELPLNYRLDRDARRWCVGHNSQIDGYVDCVTELTEPGRTCARCSAAEAIFASQLHHAHTQPRRTAESEMGQHLLQENVLYLAGFRDGSIKIGTSTASRQRKRLLEQGAWQAVIVATAVDGYAVREIEDRVTEALAIPQAVLGGRKLGGLVEPIDDALLGADLQERFAEVADLIRAGSDPRYSVVGEEWENPAVDRSVWRDVRRYPLNPQRGSHKLVVNDIVGRIVAAARPSPTDGQPHDVFAIDLQKLYGFQLELGAFTSDELVIQDSLF